jgi:hypothetical protein
LSWARTLRSRAGMVTIPAAVEMRKSRRFMALPRLTEREGLDAKINRARA